MILLILSIGPTLYRYVGQVLNRYIGSMLYRYIYIRLFGEKILRACYRHSTQVATTTFIPDTDMCIICADGGHFLYNVAWRCDVVAVRLGSYLYM